MRDILRSWPVASWPASALAYALPGRHIPPLNVRDVKPWLRHVATRLLHDPVDMWNHPLL